MLNDTNTHELGQEHWVTEILGEKQDSLSKCLYGDMVIRITWKEEPNISCRGRPRRLHATELYNKLIDPSDQRTSLDTWKDYLTDPKRHRYITK